MRWSEKSRTALPWLLTRPEQPPLTIATNLVEVGKTSGRLGLTFYWPNILQPIKPASQRSIDLLL